MLFKAIRFNHLRIVQELLYRKVSQNAEFSAMNYAASCGNRKILNYLITYGGDINEKDLLGFTPLMNAAREGHVEIADLLLSAGKLDITHITPTLFNRGLLWLFLNLGADIYKIHEDTCYTATFIALLNGNLAIYEMIRSFSLMN